MTGTLTHGTMNPPRDRVCCRILILALIALPAAQQAVAQTHTGDVTIADANPHIKFDNDAGSDWQIWVDRPGNDSDNPDESGSFFEIAWFPSTGGNTRPFKILPGNVSDVLCIGGNNLGIRTCNPGEEITIATPNPSLRLARSSVQTWDIEAVTTHFRIFDVTANSEVFVIDEGAPEHSFFLATSGRLGLGTSAPGASLHVLDENAELRIQEADAAVNARTLLTLTNPGNTKFEIENTDASTTWAFTNSGTDFRISLQDSGVVEFRVDNTGDAYVHGQVYANSDRDAKTGINPIDALSVLDRVMNLPIAEWAYRDAPGVRHIGPMAQDFRASFQTGKTDTSLAPMDVAGVALAAIQALEARNRSLERANLELKARLDRIEATLTAH